jgi:chromosome segregation ATPase
MAQIDDLIAHLQAHRSLAAELDTAREKILRERSTLDALSFKIEAAKKELKELRDAIAVERHNHSKQREDDRHRHEMELAETVGAIAVAKRELAGIQGDVSKQQNTLEALVKKHSVMTRAVA